ncbi:hypothetical protein [Rhodopila sp.]
MDLTIERQRLADAPNESDPPIEPLSYQFTGAYTLHSANTERHVSGVRW